MADDLELHYKVRRARRDGDARTLIAALEDDIEASIAADYLGDMGAVAAIPALIELLAATKPNQRAAAALALGKLKSSDACSRLTELAEHDDVPWVRSCAITALGGLPCDSGTVLVRALDDCDIRVRRAAVTVLMDVGGPGVVAQLRAARRREHWFSRGVYGKAIRRVKRRTS